MPRPERVGGSGTLFIVATPIGNLEDITLRALRVLREVAVVAAEDTRRTSNLLRHYEIRTPLLSLHEHNERLRLPQLIGRLEAGASIALVTDAGTPGISDPGAQIVAGVRERGLRIEPIPGPSSVATALSVSGQPAGRFACLGFPPVRSKDRTIFFHRVLELSDMLVVLFEAPHRMLRTLEDLGAILGDRPITVARELTKAHEETIVGTTAELLGLLDSPRGEFTLLISPGDHSSASQPDVEDSQVAREFGEMTKYVAGSRRDVLREVALKTGLSPKAVYEALERVKKLGT